MKSVYCELCGHCSSGRLLPEPWRVELEFSLKIVTDYACVRNYYLPVASGLVQQLCCAATVLCSNCVVQQL